MSPQPKFHYNQTINTDSEKIPSFKNLIRVLGSYRLYFVSFNNLKCMAEVTSQPKFLSNRTVNTDILF